MVAFAMNLAWALFMIPVRLLGYILLLTLSLLLIPVFLAVVAGVGLHTCWAFEWAAVNLLDIRGADEVSCIGGLGMLVGAISTCALFNGSGQRIVGIVRGKQFSKGVKT